MTPAGTSTSPTPRINGMTTHRHLLLFFFFIPKVAEVRKEVEERENSGQKASLLGGKGKGGGGGGAAMDSHVRDMQKEEENRRMREAFGLGEDYAAGEAFDEETQARKKEARKK